jgi:acyl-CoA synthetase
VSHHIGTVALDQVLVAGCEMVLSDPSAGIHAIDWIEQCGATYVMGVPTHAIDILAAMRKRGMERLGRVKVFYMAGAPIPRETADRMLALGITPQNVYGMTECGSHNYTMPGDPPELIAGTCGRSCRAYEIKIWNEASPDAEVPSGQIGEIGGRGGQMMLGYFNNQAATAATFNAHGYLMSGDLGCVDAEGNLQVVGRKKDIIIRGGHNIHPARIEDLALRHQGILRAAAIPVADDRLGERVCLAIVPRHDAPPTGEEMVAHLREEGLSKYDLPEFFVILAEFPLTASGKILKRSLIDWHRAGRFTPIEIRRQPSGGNAG